MVIGDTYGDDDANEPLNNVINFFAALDSVQKKVRFCAKLSFCANLSKMFTSFTHQVT